jgi:tRNA modification GTPase
VQGTSRARFEELRTSTIRCLAYVEALIDFGEGEDIEEGTFDTGMTQVQCSQVILIEP